MPCDLSLFCVPGAATLREVISRMNANRQGIVLVIDQERRLTGTITDGDLRRAVLAGMGLEEPAARLLAGKASSPYPQPITAPLDSERGHLLRLMKQSSVRHIPLLDAAGRVADLVVMADLVAELDQPLRAVVMAGGQGSRLAPLTGDCPKPMLPVGDRPLLEHILEQLRKAGVRQVNLATHYLGEKIQEHFGDGGQFGLELSYVWEDRPLGTAGALGLIEGADEPLLIINGDILTNVDFRALRQFHEEQRAALTVAVRKYDLAVPYGVVETSGPLVDRLVEKPVLSFFVNAGIYLLEPEVLTRLEPGQRMDMTELIQVLLAEGQRVTSFPVIEYWLDIGTHSDYQRAIEDYQNGRMDR